MEHREADVVIVGAGLAGLTAARRVEDDRELLTPAHRRVEKRLGKS